jgi:predicted transcriptional regulator
VLTTLRLLEEKGYLTHVKEGRAFIYQPAVGREEACESAVSHLVRRFFNGSHGLLALNLIENKRIDASELKRLRKTIGEAK